MRKLFYLILGGMLLGMGFTSCNDEPDNPGDMSIRGSLGVVSITSSRGHSYNLVVSREFDTIINGICRYIKMEPLNIAAEADTLTFTITSNSRWSAWVGNNMWWYKLKSNTGNGDAYMEVETFANAGTATRGPEVQYICTQDSATMYEIPIMQVGKGN